MDISLYFHLTWDAEVGKISVWKNLNSTTIIKHFSQKQVRIYGC